MHVRVEVRAGGSDAPPPGSPVLVQVVDAALQDAAATVLAETRVASVGEPVIAVAELDVPRPGAYPIVQVHVDVDGDGKVSEGDFITMQSYPCRGGAMSVEIRRV